MKLARVLTLVVVPLGHAFPAVAAPAGGTLVVLNKSEATASLIDLESGKVVATLPTGQAPHEVAVSPDGRLALAANYGTRAAPGSTLTLIDVPGARVVKTIDLGGYRRPHGVVWLADGKRALVTAEERKALLTVDVEAGKVARAVATDQDVSHMVAVLPDGSRASSRTSGRGRSPPSTSGPARCSARSRRARVRRASTSPPTGGRSGSRTAPKTR